MRKALLDWLIILFSMVIYMAGLGLTIMDVDSAQYASISQEMARTNEFLEVQNKGSDYLDKPPLLFWVSAVSFKIFGVYNWSFKLIPFLFAMMSVFATYRLGTLLINNKVGRWAAVMLLTCQAYFLFTLDLRTDTMLTACVVLGVWQIMEFAQGDKKKRRLIFGFLFVGLAMLAKGPIGLVIPMIAVGSQFLFNRQWKQILRWEWLVGLAVTAAVLVPMSYGLYNQFDTQPDKVVMMPSPSGMTPRSDISGLRFYFWEQSFGRITGENVWKDSSGPFFFVHNFLWSFAPWSFFAFIAFFWKLKRETLSLIKSGQGEFLTILGFLIPFIVLSRSHFKLPHYIFPLFPFAAIFTAECVHYWVSEMKPKTGKIVTYSLSVFSVLAVSLLGFTIVFFVFPETAVVKWIYVVLVGFAIWLLTQKPLEYVWVRSIIVAALGFNMVMNMHFYPSLLKYQKGSELAAIAFEEGATGENTVYLKDFAYSFDVYLQSDIPVRGSADRIKPNETFIFTTKEGLKDLKKSNRKISKEIRFLGYPVTNLSTEFLNPETRNNALKESFLVVLADVR